jgi:spermidine/putrescine transport system substrate-binding protein
MVKKGITLMKFLLPFFFLIAALIGCQSSNLPELHVFMWSHYIKPEIIVNFEQKYRCRVILDTYDSNEAMYAKLKLGAEGYDLIFPSSYFFELMTQQKMIQPIDFETIPNYKSIDPAYLKRTPKHALAYGIPYLMSITGIAYRTDRISHPDPTWGIFAKKEYKGRMTLLNDLREAIGAALIYLGYSLNTTHRKEIDEAADLLIAWKKNLAKFESEQYKNGIASAEYLFVQGYSGDILQIMQENPNIGFFYPKQGTIMSMDYLAIPQGTQNPKLAHEFINYLLEGEIAAENVAFTFFLSPNLAAYSHLTPELRENPILFPAPEILQKSEMINNVGEAYTYYIKAWERIKAAD